MDSNTLLPLAVALMIGVPDRGSCIGIGLASGKSLEVSARPVVVSPW